MYISFKKVATLTDSCHLKNPLAFVYQTICLRQQSEQIGEYCPCPGYASQSFCLVRTWAVDYPTQQCLALTSLYSETLTPFLAQPLGWRGREETIGLRNPRIKNHKAGSQHSKSYLKDMDLQIKCAFMFLSHRAHIFNSSVELWSFFIDKVLIQSYSSCEIMTAVNRAFSLLSSPAQSFCRD